MSTFTQLQQKKHRQVFIEEYRQKAWSAACNAEWISKQSDELLAQYEKLKKEDAELEEQIKALDNAVDYHTKDNRDKRKALQEHRIAIGHGMQFLQKSATEAQQAMSQLYANVEQNLALAAHAEKWEWKEAVTPPPPASPPTPDETSRS